ncbi:FMN dependent NADH:quinone oxidoreductase [Novosphingobium lubricantis]|jgi:FMN-dependent NADH-azoreductase
MKILHIDSSIMGEHSVSRRLSAAAAVHLRAQHADAEYTHLDLVARPVPHLTGATMAALQSPEGHAPGTLDDLALGNAIIDQFLAADVVIFGVGLYNFSVPSQLKTWIDRIMVPGRTFRYTPHGPQGITPHKRIIIAISRGGDYNQSPQIKAMEHCETYLQTVFAIIGIPDIEFVIAEGVSVSDDARQNAINKTLGEIAAL